jgi:preprotein translocase subunit SecD
MELSFKNIMGSSFILWAVGAVAIGYYMWPIKQRVRFGIDLVGGTYITLSVQTDKALEAELHDKVKNLTKKLEEEGKSAPQRVSVKGSEATITLNNASQAQEAADLLRADGFDVSTQDTVITLKLQDTLIKKITDAAVEGNVKVLDTRLNSLGVGEILIAPQGERNIVIELPNVSNPQVAKAMIGKAAVLEVKMVEFVGPTEEAILDRYDGELPDGMEIVPDKRRNNDGTPLHYYLVPDYADLTGRLLKDASVGFAQPNGTGRSEVVVNFAFKAEGAELFYDLTRKSYNRPIAIIVDNIVISAPVAHQPISGGSGYIYGTFTPESAKELASLLKSGAFVAPVTFEEERIIGPSLGAESIRQGLNACLVGLILLLLFSIVAYKLCGLFAFIVLLYNLLLVGLALSFLEATLTLPGIAGMVLTIGMAIDASILIYEKIREELASGTDPKKAVDLGFSDALMVILDSNITTFIVGIVLYKFGTGPIQGFAVTMMVGIVTTLLTGLFFLRSIFNFILYNLGIQKLII